MHKIDQKNAKHADDSSVLPLPTWKFTFEDLNFSLYGYFTSNDEDLAVNQRFQGNVWLAFSRNFLNLVLFIYSFDDISALRNFV